MTLRMIVKVGAIIIVSPIFSIPAAITFLIGGWIGHIYMRTQLPVKRESSKAKAPVLGHFDSAIGGLGSPAIALSVWFLIDAKESA